jgi:glycosyltransferase involved in cell wall biosynthesis
VLILRRFKPDVTHAQAMWMGLPAFVTKKVINKPYLIWAQGSDIYFPRLFKGPISKLVLRNANALIALTRDMKREMQKVCNRDIFVIGNGIDPKKFGSHAKKEARYQLHIGEDERVIIFVGTLVPGKGVRYLIEGFKYVVDKFNDVQLIIVGTGPLETKLKKMTGELNMKECVRFEGFVEHRRVGDYYTLSDILVFPSIVDSSGFEEGLPVVLLEALTVGKPVVAIRTRGVMEVIKDGWSGFLVEQKNPEKIAEKVLELLNDEELRMKISKNALETGKKYDWEILGGKYEEIINRIKVKGRTLR